MEENFVKKKERKFKAGQFGSAFIVKRLKSEMKKLLGLYV